MYLNEQQRTIVKEASGRVAVVAGAGSGKTTTNIQLIQKIYKEDNVPLEKMWITTFTNKAGRDLKSKLRRNLNLDKETVDKLWVGTFHSLGYRYLTQIKRKKLEIILPIEAKQYLRNIYKQVLKNNKVDEDEFSFTIAVNNIDKQRNRECDWNDASEYPEECKAIYDMYQSEKEKMGMVDYEDILSIFERELTLDKSLPEQNFCNRFEWVFVDESQDNSVRQNRIAELLTFKNQVLTGDPKQSIYLFRGAAPELFKQKIAEADKVFPLSSNYRSSKEIIEFANSLLVQMDSFVGQDLIATKPGLGKPTFTLCDNQALELLRGIQKDLREGIPHEEIAVLGRSIKPQVFQNLQVLLRSQKIPYSLRGGDDKLNASYIQNYLSVLKSVLKPTKVSLTNALGMLPAVGPKTAMKLAEEVSAAGGSFEPLVNNTSKFATTKAYGAFLNLEQVSHDNKELILRTLDFIYSYYLVPVYGKKDPNEPANKKKIIFDSLYNYLMEYKDLMEGIDSLYINEEDLESEKGKIIISTIHQSKGLEFDSVHIANFCENSIPNLKEHDEGDLSRLEEEFCLAYVAITRAKKRLNMYMSFLSDSYGNAPNKLSRFLKETFGKTKERFFNFRILDVSSESNYKESLYNKIRATYEQQ